MFKVKAVVFGAIVAVLPFAGHANEFVNADNFSASLTRIQGVEGVGLSARGSVIPNGKIYVEMNEAGGAEYGSVGYRHSFPGRGAVTSAFIGAAFVGTTTDFDFGVDAEMAVGRNGVASGRYSYQWGFSLGYTHYLNRNMGLKLEASELGSALGVSFKF